MEPEEEPDDVILVQESLSTEMVPCELCGAKVAFSEFVVHMSICQERSEAVPAADNEDITCDVCGEIVPFNSFVEHSKKHSADQEGAACQVCGVWLGAKELADHLAAHKVHDQWLDRELKTSTSAVDITAQVVEMARAGGAGLPGNRRHVAVGDAVLVHWSDGHWYGGHVRAMDGGDSGPREDKISVAWDPPYAHWAPERVAEHAVIPRMNQPREVCNFDVALQFVNKLCSMKGRDNKATKLEVVYHWTGEENVQKIVENNLKTPGSTNADGSAVQRLNGEAYGKGIYAATDLNYGKGFGRGLSCAFLCLAIPGHMSQSQTMKLSSRDDSFKHGCLRVYRTSEQVLPLFFTDSNSSAKLAECAWDIADLLKERALGQVKDEAEFRKGARVEAFWQGAFWKAEVWHVHRDGTYDLKWQHPYQYWPKELRVSPDRLRRYEDSTG